MNDKNGCSSTTEVDLADEPAALRNQLSEIIEGLAPRRLPWFSRRHYTMRTFNHTVGWATEWVGAEYLDLESFLEAGHSYERKILLHPNGAAAEVVFRLTGKGLK